jgi:hypothetical protein
VRSTQASPVSVSHPDGVRSADRMAASNERILSLITTVAPCSEPPRSRIEPAAADKLSVMAIIVSCRSAAGVAWASSSVYACAIHDPS